MLAIPGEPPVTLPEISTDAIVDELEDHVPPGVEGVSATVAPEHTLSGPVGIVGGALTLITLELVQPLLVNEYTTVAAPVPTPVTIPVVAPTVATDGNAVVLHVPEPLAVSVIVFPIHTTLGPLIAEGNGFTVNIAAL